MSPFCFYLFIIDKSFIPYHEFKLLKRNENLSFYFPFFLTLFSRSPPLFPEFYFLPFFPPFFYFHFVYFFPPLLLVFKTSRFFLFCLCGRVEKTEKRFDLLSDLNVINFLIKLRWAKKGKNDEERLVVDDEQTFF